MPPLAPPCPPLATPLLPCFIGFISMIPTLMVYTKVGIKCPLAGLGNLPCFPIFSMIPNQPFLILVS